MSDCKNCKLLDGQSITFVYHAGNRKWFRGYKKCACINALELSNLPPVETKTEPMDFIMLLCKVYERLGGLEGQLELCAADDRYLQERIEKLEEKLP